MRIQAPIRADHVDQEIYAPDPQFLHGEADVDGCLCDMTAVIYTYGSSYTTTSRYDLYVALVAVPYSISDTHVYWSEV